MRERDTNKCILFEIQAGIIPAIPTHLAYSIDTELRSELSPHSQKRKRERERELCWNNGIVNCSLVLHRETKIWLYLHTKVFLFSVQKVTISVTVTLKLQ